MPVLYQTWKTKIIPQQFKEYRKKWLQLTPDYLHPILDDRDLRNIIYIYFPEYIEKYDSFSHHIERVDFARYAILCATGDSSIYADLDTYPLKPMDYWVNTQQIILGREPIEHAREIYSREIVICNALMVSPNTKEAKLFWLDLMKFIMDNYEYNYNPVYNTGPMAITKFYEKHPEKFYNVVITDPCVFFPLKGDGKISSFCKENKEMNSIDPGYENQTFVVHVWSNTWVQPFWKDPRWFNFRYWTIGFIFLLLFIFICVMFKGNRKN